MKLQWSSQKPDRDGVQWLLVEPWIILVHDPESGGWWTVYPHRELLPGGKQRSKPEGVVFTEEKPHELARVLKEADAGEVWLLQIMTREKLA